MKVTIVADVLGRENNGTTIACMNLVRYLTSCGDEVKIVCCDTDKKGRENYFVVPTLNLGPFINRLVEKNQVQLAKIDKKILNEAITGADIVHLLMPFAIGKAAVKICRKRNIPCTASFHCQAENFSSHVMMMNSTLFNRLVYKNFYSHFYKYTDAVHYPTDFIKETFEKTVHHCPNSYVISNGVNEKYRKRPTVRPDTLCGTDIRGKILILFTGRLAKEKSHKLLVKASTLSEHRDEIQLVFAGQGPREREIRNYVKRVKAKEPIIKFFSRSELVDILNVCDLYCHPAEIEIEAISCLEAISCGLVPVINNSPRSATRFFALSEKNLFDFNDAKDLAAKIDYWIDHPEEKKKCSEQYLGYADRFDQKKCMEEMRSMLQDTIKLKKEKLQAQKK